MNDADIRTIDNIHAVEVVDLSEATYYRGSSVSTMFNQGSTASEGNRTLVV